MHVNTYLNALHCRTAASILLRCWQLWAWSMAECKLSGWPRLESPARPQPRRWSRREHTRSPAELCASLQMAPGSSLLLQTSRAPPDPASRLSLLYLQTAEDKLPPAKCPLPRLATLWSSRLSASMPEQWRCQRSTSRSLPLPELGKSRILRTGTWRQ